MPDPQAFAAEWIAAWNARDLARILSHYAEDVVFRSPRIAQVMGTAEAEVRGKPALARYWGRALAGAPDLAFELTRVYAGAGSLSLAYRNHRGQDAVETFVFGDDGLVAASIANYA